MKQVVVLNLDGTVLSREDIPDEPATDAPADPIETLKADLTAAIKAAPNTIAGVKAAILGAVADQ